MFATFVVCGLIVGSPQLTMGWEQDGVGNVSRFAGVGHVRAGHAMCGLRGGLP